ncbi:Protein of unknown function [Amycolatopsis arida]|uniref:DUF3558 domain-containing protein n=2 Tax=Amycolatopsis arida TaxID=587909 RepID=A0A1I5Z2S6_9PSEU|nr:uncharacterized protein DUF3558 [Amycolatopsis arida]SFQ50786.1 Protein of unknown function [Amycolatopsis arida]
MLTPQQASDLAGLSSPEADTADKIGPRCEWDQPGGGLFTISFITVGGGGLSGTYQSHAELPMPYFEPVDVNGYPGVFADQVDRRSYGACGLSVGVRDDVLLKVFSGFERDSPHYGDPCPVVKKAAEMAITTMEGGA